ncbi:uncharacterized protein LOC105207072 isoform X2 [Solenopsis invicta]|uniref:uncharacterized protein LOC105207072 isoform X2 n=1 Tax=Solenopsis invicta TaxID=13686 RepID=UPI00193CB9AD|nr:uncharacterized protein LOC105207072 isoform X2 [Solenopsis invicta]
MSVSKLQKKVFCVIFFFYQSSFTSHISKIHKNRYDQAEIVTVENPVVESEESLNNTLLEIDDQPNMIVQHEPYNAQYDANESDLFLKNVGQFYLKLENRKMPLFKVESPSHKRIMIKANSISEIIEIAIKKLKLPEDNTYKLLLQNDGTEIDDNDVLLEYAEQSKDKIVLTILDINMSSDYNKKNEDNQIVLNESSSTMQRNDISDSSSISTCSEALSSSNRSSTKVKSINLEDGVWSKLSERIVAACVRGDKLCFSDRKAVIQKIVEYMIDTLKNTTRSKAHEIATILCNTYPKTFADTIGNDEMWGSGLETVRLEIYNACLYKINSKKRKSFSKATNYDSDDAEQEERQQQATSRRQDEYGCVEYAPILLDENAESENKRRTLLELFALHEINPQVLKLMEETYPTLRAVLNDKNRNLEIIAAEWPFLQETDCFFQYCSRLLGKNVVQVWTNSLSNKTKSIRQYFKHSQKKKANEINEIINDCKTAVQIRKDKIPKLLVIFRLLIFYFNEKENFLFKIIGNDVDDADVINAADTEYPVLIIRGKSLYDENAKCTVIIGKKVSITSTNSLEGILITFLAYYVYGF